MPVKGEVTLSGTTVEEVTVLDALALRDTSHTVTNIDVGRFRQISLTAMITLNKPISVKIYGGPTRDHNFGLRVLSDASWSATGEAILSGVTISTPDRTALISSAFPEIFNVPVLPFSYMALYITASEAPTSGAVTFKLRGVKG
jgi:hypothetical protein